MRFRERAEHRFGNPVLNFKSLNESINTIELGNGNNIGIGVVLSLTLLHLPQAMTSFREIRLDRIRPLEKGAHSPSTRMIENCILCPKGTTTKTGRGAVIYNSRRKVCFRSNNTLNTISEENMLLRIFKRSLCVVTMILVLTNPVLLPYFSLPERKLL